MTEPHDNTKVNLAAAETAAYATLALTFNETADNDSVMKPVMTVLNRYGGHHMFWILDTWTDAIRDYAPEGFDPFTHVATQPPERGTESWNRLAPLGIGPARALYQAGECFNQGREPSQEERDFANKSAYSIYMSTVDQGWDAIEATVSVMLACAHTAVSQGGLDVANQLITDARERLMAHFTEHGESLF